MEIGILKIQTHANKIFLELLPDHLEFFHAEIYMYYVLIELLKVQDWSPFVRSTLRFRYCKV